MVTNKTRNNENSPIGYIYIYIYIHQVMLLAQITLTLSPPVLIVRCSWHVFQTASCVHTTLLSVSSSSLADTGTSLSIRERHFWVRPCFSSSVSHVLFVLLGWFFETGSKWPYSHYIYCYISKSQVSGSSQWTKTRLIRYLWPLTGHLLIVTTSGMSDTFLIHSVDGGGG